MKEYNLVIKEYKSEVVLNNEQLKKAMLHLVQTDEVCKVNLYSAKGYAKIPYNNIGTSAAPCFINYIKTPEEYGSLVSLIHSNTFHYYVGIKLSVNTYMIKQSVSQIRYKLGSYYDQVLDITTGYLERCLTEDRLISPPCPWAQIQEPYVVKQICKITQRTYRAFRNYYLRCHTNNTVRTTIDDFINEAKLTLALTPLDNKLIQPKRLQLESNIYVDKANYITFDDTWEGHRTADSSYIDRLDVNSVKKYGDNPMGKIYGRRKFQDTALKTAYSRNLFLDERQQAFQWIKDHADLFTEAQVYDVDNTIKCCNCGKHMEPAYTDINDNIIPSYCVHCGTPNYDLGLIFTTYEDYLKATENYSELYE